MSLRLVFRRLKSETRLRGGFPSGCSRLSSLCSYYVCCSKSSEVFRGTPHLVVKLKFCGCSVWQRLLHNFARVLSDTQFTSSLLHGLWMHLMLFLSNCTQIHFLVLGVEGAQYLQSHSYHEVGTRLNDERNDLEAEPIDPFSLVADELLTLAKNLRAMVLAEGIITAPILFAIEEFPQLRAIVNQGFDDPSNVDLALHYLGKSQGIQKTRELASQHANLAAAAIGSLPKTDDVDVRVCRRALVDLTQNYNQNKVTDSNRGS